MVTKVFITIDVECGEHSPDYDGCVWGRLQNIPGQEYGLLVILKLLKEVNLRGVFFLEALSSYRHGISNLTTIADRILSDGHEIQLHIHPSLRHPKRNPNTEIHIGKYPLNKQIDFIERGIVVLEKCGAKEISAFRAGGFGINNNTFQALRECGIRYDSSFNLNYLNKSCILNLTEPQRNDAFQYQDILEFPVTCFQNPLSNKIPYRHLQITASSYPEIKKTLVMAHLNKMKSVTILLHSSEFIRFLNKEKTIGKPININIKRFTKLLKFLSLNNNMFEVGGFNDLSNSYIHSITERDHQPDFVPKLPFHMKISRQLEQLMARY